MPAHYPYGTEVLVPLRVSGASLARRAARVSAGDPGDCGPVPAAAAAALMARRFRGYLPVAIDVETGGFHAATDALLEIAATLIDMDADGTLQPRRHA